MTNNEKILKIFLADDDTDDCLLFRDALSELSIESALQIFRDGEQLMHQLLLSEPTIPDVLFLDLNMPRKNGFDCLIEIKNHESLKNIPVIIISTYYDQHYANQLYQIGANYYIQKPADFMELKNSIHHVLLLLLASRKVNELLLQPTEENFLVSKFKNAF